jgi:hypothetical protein
MAILLFVFLLMYGSVRDILPKISFDQFDDVSKSEGELNQREITITNFGWYHPNSSHGITYKRCQAMRHFNDAIIAHERFNASAWQDLQQNPNPERAIIAFLDYDTCQLYHWPKFGGNEFNADTEGGRARWTRPDWSEECSMIERALQSPALLSPDSRLVVISCEDADFGADYCLGANREVNGIFSKLVVGHMSSHKNDTHPLDFGMPPWPVKTAVLNQSQIHEIGTCKENRPLLYSFIGRGRKPFPQFNNYMKSLHGKHGVHAVFQVKHYVQSDHPLNAVGGSVLVQVAPENQTKDDFYNLLMNSEFFAAPRGDCLYSVRFSEILSSGAIPVVFGDGWVLPYNEDVVDWSELAVLLPQSRVKETLDVIRAIPNETRCQMRKKGLDFFQRYVADSAGRLRAVLKIVDAALAREKKNSSDPPMEFSAVPEYRR